MSYDYITQYTSGNRTRGRGAVRITRIVIHWWNDPQVGATFDGVINWLCRPNGMSSAHYVVEAGRVACLVDAKDTAWHAGDFDINQRSIGIECNPRMSDADLETVAELIADIRKVYGDLVISPHSYHDQTNCPGTYRNKLNWLRERSSQILAGKRGTPAPTPAVTVDGWLGPATVKAWQKAVGTPQDGVISSQPDTLKHLHDGLTSVRYEPAATAEGSQLIAKVQSNLQRRGLYAGDIDGCFGPMTIKALQHYYGTPQDGVISGPSQMVIALQKALNQQLGGK